MKKLLLPFISILALPFFLQAQLFGKEVIWDGSGHTSKNVYPLSDGSSLVTLNKGSYYSPCAIAKIDANGDTLLVKEYIRDGGFNLDWQFIKERNDGSFVLAGYALYGGANTAIFAIADSNLNLTSWQAYKGAVSGLFLKDLEVADDNSIYYAGNYYDLYSGGVSFYTWNFPMVGRLNPDLTDDWVKTFGNHNSSNRLDGFVFQIDIDNDGNILAWGQYEQGVGSGTNYLAKFSPSGTAIWRREKFEPGSLPNSMAVDSSGNIYTGRRISDASGLYGGYDIIVEKIGTNGDTLWTKIVGSSINEYLTAMTIDPNGYVLLTGAYNDPVSGFNKAFISKLSAATGDMEWTKAYGSTASNSYSIDDIEYTAYDQYLMVGYISGGGSWLVQTDWDGDNSCVYDTLSWSSTTWNSELVSGTSPASEALTSVSVTCSTYTDTSYVEVSSCYAPAPCAASANFSPSDTSACIGDTINFSNSSIGGVSFSWEMDGIPFASTTNAEYSFGSAGSFAVRLIADNGTCTDTSAVKVINVDAGAAVSASSDTTICQGDTISISASSTGSMSWDNGLGAGASHAVNPSLTTTYIVTATAPAGCPGRDTVNITVNDVPGLIASPDTSICEGDGTTISASGVSSYEWDNGLGSGASHPVSPGSTTTYMVTGTDAMGCTATRSVIISVNDNPVAEAGPAISACSGTGGMLMGSASGGTGPYDFLWSSGDSIASPVISPSSPTTYDLTVTDVNGCSSTDNVFVSIAPSPLANAGGDKDVCSGDTVTLSGIGAGGIPPYDFLWMPSGDTTADITFSPTLSTMHILEVTDVNGCSARDTVMITIGSPSIANFSHSTSLSVVTFTDASTNAATWLWDFGDLSSSSDASPVHNYLSTGIFNVCLTTTSPDGCTDTRCDSVEILILDRPEVAGQMEMSVYPNPNKGDFIVSFQLAEAGEWKLTLTDLRGALVRSETGDAGAGKIDHVVKAKELAAGTYILQVQTIAGIGWRKVVLR